MKDVSSAYRYINSPNIKTRRRARAIIKANKRARRARA